MPSPTVEFRYLQVVTNALAGDRATVGLVHWDGTSLRFVFATGAVRALATYDDIDHSVAALERAMRRRVRHIKPGPTIFPRALGEFLPDAEMRTGDALVWSPVHVGFARDAQGHFDELQERLGLRARLPKGRHAFAKVLRDALEELAQDLQPRWGDELVRPAHKVRSHYEYIAPISWKNGNWNHAVPVSLAVDLASDLHANVRDAIARVVTSVPSADTPVLVAVLPQDQAKAVAAEQEAQYMRDALRPREARLTKVRMRVDTGSLDVDPVRQMIERDVAHAARA